ncbi:hypothetical protein ES703_92764 [subsurface metagenome]
MATPVRVISSSLSSSEVAIPKSASFTSPLFEMSTLAGLISLCITPLSWAYFNPLLISFVITSAAEGVICFFCAISSSRESPLTNSMAI